MPSPGRVGARSACSTGPLAPPWAGRVAAAAILCVGLLGALVWHATKLDQVDAWAYRWQAIAHQHAGRVAAVISGTEAPVVVLAMLACALVSWRAPAARRSSARGDRRTGGTRRRDAA